MSNLSDGHHPTHSFESKIMGIVHAPIVNALARHNVLGTSVSDKELVFRYEGRTITISIKATQ